MAKKRKNKPAAAKSKQTEPALPAKDEEVRDASPEVDEAKADASSPELVEGDNEDTDIPLNDTSDTTADIGSTATVVSSDRDTQAEKSDDAIGGVVRDEVNGVDVAESPTDLSQSREPDAQGEVADPSRAKEVGETAKHEQLAAGTAEASDLGVSGQAADEPRSETHPGAALDLSADTEISLDGDASRAVRDIPEPDSAVVAAQADASASPAAVHRLTVENDEDVANVARIMSNEKVPGLAELKDAGYQHEEDITGSANLPSERAAPFAEEGISFNPHREVTTAASVSEGSTTTDDTPEGGPEHFRRPDRRDRGGAVLGSPHAFGRSLPWDQGRTRVAGEALVNGEDEGEDVGGMREDFADVALGDTVTASEPARQAGETEPETQAVVGRPGDMGDDGDAGITGPSRASADVARRASESGVEEDSAQRADAFREEDGDIGMPDSPEKVTDASLKDVDIDDDTASVRSRHSMTDRPEEVLQGDRRANDQDAIQVSDEYALSRASQAPSSPNTPASPARPDSPDDSDSQQQYRPLDQNINLDSEDETDGRTPSQPSFFSVRPGATDIGRGSKPAVPMSRPIAVDEDDTAGVMTNVQISPSTPSAQLPGDTDKQLSVSDGSGVTSPLKSPSRKKSWFPSFGRRKTDEKVESALPSQSRKASEGSGFGSAHGANTEDASRYAGYERSVSGAAGDRPDMGTRNLSSGGQSVHSAHSHHSETGGIESVADARNGSRFGSRRPSQLASPLPTPTTAGSEGGASTKASTPTRRHAPPAKPFPFPIPPSPERKASAASYEPSQESEHAPPVANTEAEAVKNDNGSTGNVPSTASSSAPAETLDSATAAATMPATVVAAVEAIVPPAPKPSTSTAAPVPASIKDTGIGAKGVSAFEKVMSHTRPSHLPPKPKEEDDTHYHQWEEMMAAAREHEAQRRKAAEIRRVEREKKLAAYTPKWEMLLQGAAPNLVKVKEEEGLRKMWFEGVPGHLRNKAWSAAIGNPLAMSKDAYRSYVSRARKAIDSGRFPQDTLDAIERDMSLTLRQTKMFVQGSPMRMDLHELLTAWVVYRSDDGMGYAPYVSHIAAMLLIPSPPAQAFLNLVNLLARPCMRAFVTETKDEIDAFYRVFENLQADTFPKIYANCSNLGLKLPESYFRSVLVEQVPFEACCRSWDQILLDGDGYIFRAALAIFGFLEPRLHYPDKEEILSVLEGRNKATHAITEREKERARLRGEAYDDELDGKLSVFGLNEDALFGWLETDGWKEARYERLVVREMPD